MYGSIGLRVYIEPVLSQREREREGEVSILMKIVKGLDIENFSLIQKGKTPIYILFSFQAY